MKKFNLKSYIKGQLHEGITKFQNQEEIDALLDKVHKFGIDGISPADKRRLQRLTSDDPDNAEILHNEKPIEDRVELLSPSSVGRYGPMKIVSHKLKEEGWDWSRVDPKHIQTVKKGPDAEYYWSAWDEIINQVRITKNGEECYIAYTQSDIWLVPKDVDTDELEQWLGS